MGVVVGGNDDGKRRRAAHMSFPGCSQYRSGKLGSISK
jgi:hypothetical protein